MTLDLERFAKIVGMLGSEHAGERAAAAKKAKAMLDAAGMTWEDFVRGHGTTPTPRHRDDGPGPQSHARIASDLLYNFGRWLQPASRDFLREVSGPLAYVELSGDQIRHLNRIRARCDALNAC